jgi:hypothetical protein
MRDGPPAFKDPRERPFASSQAWQAKIIFEIFLSVF